MAKVKINSIGFGCDKYLKMSNGLIWAGILLTVTGQLIDSGKWYVGTKQETVEEIRKLYDAIKK